MKSVCLPLFYTMKSDAKYYMTSRQNVDTPIVNRQTLLIVREIELPYLPAGVV